MNPALPISPRDSVTQSILSASSDPPSACTPAIPSHAKTAGDPLPRSAGFQTCCVAGFPAGRRDAIQSGPCHQVDTPNTSRSLSTLRDQSMGALHRPSAHPAGPPALTGSTPEPGLANELSPLSDGWVRISPYGDFLKERQAPQRDGTIRYERYLQRVDRAAAETMVREFNTLLGSETLGKIRRFLVGKPIYKGHPDLPEAARRYPDPTRYGFISGLEARPDGLYGRIVLAEDAQAIIARDGLQWLSPFWLVRLTGQAEDGVPVCTPVKLLSAGLTHSPNIRGGQPLANEQPPALMEKAILITLLGLANNASEEQIQSAITDLKAKAALVPALEDRQAQLTAKLAGLENENEAGRNRLQKERKARINLLLDSSINSGRITAGERPSWERALSNENEFEAKAAELSRLVPRMKTVSLTGHLGQRNAVLENESDRRAHLLALVADKQSKGLSYHEAFSAVQRENPELFKRMKQPEKSEA